MTRMTRILFLTTELTPFAKVGGLADVSAALPAALARQGEVSAPSLPELFIAVMGENA